MEPLHTVTVVQAQTLEPDAHDIEAAAAAAARLGAREGV